ncbi:hypothetical protein Tco_1218923 [Tanacetum coccineum]
MPHDHGIRVLNIGKFCLILPKVTQDAVTAYVSRSHLTGSLKDGWIDSLQELSTLGTSLNNPLSKCIVYHPRPLNDLKTSTTLSKKSDDRYNRSWEWTYLDKECPLNKEVKQLEEVKYGEFGRSAPFNGNKRAKFHVEINTRIQSASLKNLETQIEQLTKELQARTTNGTPSSSAGECKVVNNDHETQHRPISLNDKEE